MGPVPVRVREFQPRHDTNDGVHCVASGDLKIAWTWLAALVKLREKGGERLGCEELERIYDDYRARSLEMRGILSVPLPWREETMCNADLD